MPLCTKCNKLKIDLEFSDLNPTLCATCMWSYAPKKPNPFSRDKIGADGLMKKKPRALPEL